MARLREVLTRWQDEWCVESSVPEVEVIPEDLRGPPLPGCEWRTGTAIGEVKAAVGLTVRASDSLLSALIHSSLRPITNHLKPVGVE
ncbi:MAG: hypothetical protein ACJ74E_12500, partial [Actinomycetes bacterium]